MILKTQFNFHIKQLIFCAIVISFIACKNKAGTIKHKAPSLKTTVELNKGAYSCKDTIKARLSLVNEKERLVVLEYLEFQVINILNQSLYIKRELYGKNLNYERKKAAVVELDIELPKHIKSGVYGVYIKQKEKGCETIDEYKTFFRIVGHDEITVFDIKTENYKGVPVYKLDGGMSAEYVVEKAAENLTTGISHSWEVNAPGSGPNHVLGTPNYLEKSVNKTVEFYNKVLGEDKPIETVLISAGFPSIPYISNALKAPVLPLHFLVSVNTVKEVQTILKTANDKGISSYATLSHDPSVPYAVSWIKLLELPKVYTDFIKKHKVKNVIILGATGTSGGETKAKKLVYDKNIVGQYADRSIYIMYPGTSPDDVATLKEKIIDLKDFDQQNNFVRIADWESGINLKQLTNFSKDAKEVDASIEVSTITAEDLGRLYYLGTYSTLALMHKNKEKFGDIKGVIFNPYLIAHPVIEAKKGFVPLLYWQLVGANYTVHNLEHDVFKAIKCFYPSTDVKKIKLWLNSTRNFGAVWSANNLKTELVKKGYTNFIENNYDVDEVWDLSDGVESPSELLYKEVNASYGFKHLKQWNDSLKPLTVQDIQKLSEIFGGFKVNTK